MNILTTSTVLTLTLLLAPGTGARADADSIFTSTQILDTKLAKGVSTRQDVVLLLGEPNGSGNALIPTDASATDVWYYEDVTFGLLSMKGKQQILLVFFRGGIYDGYLWFRNDVKARFE